MKGLELALLLRKIDKKEMVMHVVIRRLLSLLGDLWALPVTLFGLAYVLPCWALGWYWFDGVERVDGVPRALAWRVDLDAPSWLLRLWRGWGGHTIGHVVVLVAGAGLTTLDHELEHVEQCRRLGAFQPILYGLFLLAIWLGCPQLSPSFDYPFERDALRKAGQE